MCDAHFVWKCIVTNATNDKIIVVTYGRNHGIIADIEPNKSETVTRLSRMGATCKAQSALGEYYQGDGFRICYPGAFDTDADTYEDIYKDISFSMTVDGEEVTDDIWLNKHWTFAPDLDNYYRATYTLTVTDELLAELAATNPDR
jgi:hypothetical protein